MTQSRIGAGARSFANILTLALSLFGAWGWTTGITSWPPTFGQIGWLVLTVITLLTQQLANASAALAQRAFSRGGWISGVVGLALMFLFAGVTAMGVEHAWAATLEMAHAEAAAPLLAEIAAIEADMVANREALRALPADIPGSRLVILQAPLNEALQHAELRIEQLRADLSEASAPREDHAHLIFWSLGFAEPALYWLLAATEPSHHAVPLAGDGAQSRSDKTVGSSQSLAAVPRGLSLKRALTALAALVPGAVRPPVLPRAAHVFTETPIAEAGEYRDAPLSGSRVRRCDALATRPPRGTPQRGTPLWLRDAEALRAEGLSYRVMQRRLGVPKSTLQRWVSAPPPPGS